jgi:DNA-binding response OmpR family regulator
MLTSFDSADVTERAQHAGAEKVLIKPCPVERLALAIAASSQRDDRAPKTETARPESDQGMSGGAPRPSRVLVVDQDEDTRTYVRRLLTEAGYDVFSAASFPEGLDVLEAQQPDLLIAAMRLGAFNGLQFIAMSHRSIPTIIISDFAGRGFEADTRKLGAEYLVRPVVASELLALVKKLLPSTASTAGVRRWARRPVTTVVPAQIDDMVAQVVNVSYGGMCLQIESTASSVPSSFDVVFPDSNLSIRADAVWLSRDRDQRWLCGAEVSQVSDRWRGLVDTIS